MQSSMWKLLTVAGIIGIGTMVVLEVQNRLKTPSHATNAPATNAHATNVPDAAPVFPGEDTSVVPDSTAEFDHLLAGLESKEERSFDLNEPDDLGPPAPPVDHQEFVGVTAIDRTVRKDNLTDEISPFDHAFGPDSRAKSESVPKTAMKTSVSSHAAVIPASFTPDAPEESPTNTANTANTATTLRSSNDRSSILFFNGSRQENAQAETASKPVETPVTTAPAPTPAEKVKPVSTRVFADPGVTKAPSGTKPKTFASTAEKTVELMSFSSTQEDSESNDFFLPEPDSAPRTQPAPRVSPVNDTELMETPGFELDPKPDFDPLPQPVTPVNPGRNPATREPAPAEDSTDETPFFSVDEPVPTPPASPGDTRPSSNSDLLPPFEPDLNIGTPEPTPRSTPEPTPRSTPEPTPRSTPEPTPRNPPVNVFPDPDFPDSGFPERTPMPDLGEKSPFGGRDEGDELSKPFDLPTIDNRRERTPADRTGSEGSPRTADRPMSEVMRPQLSIQKRAPDTATVGVTHEYTIVVSNDGETPAYDLIIDDELGDGARLVNSKPTADYDPISGKLSWAIQELTPHSKQDIVVKITPTGEGTLDGVATVRFKAQVKSATVITAPRLTLELTGPKEVKVGEEVQLRYVIRNNGSGAASKVILRSVLPPGLKHSEGGDLEYEIEVLAAGDREEIDLTVVAAEPGRFRTVSEVTASGVSAGKATTDIDIIGSQLTIQRLGPDRRFVGRTAKFQNIIANETNFEASNAIVTEQVPEGMRFVSADNGGEYNPQTRRIRWDVPRLTPGKQAVLEVELEAEAAGQHQTVVEVVENAGFRSQAQENTIVTVEDFENMTADISRQDAPVAIGETFGFTITIENRGTAVAKGVEMTIEVPPEVDVKAAGSRNVPARREGNTVRYAIVEEIPPREKMTFELKLQGQKPAQNAVVRASLKYEQMQEPLIVSESITIFDDRP